MGVFQKPRAIWTSQTDSSSKHAKYRHMWADKGDFRTYASAEGGGAEAEF